MRRATCLLLIAGCLGWAAGHPLSAQQKQFGETVEIVTVEVPVQVLRDGEPVRGLTAEDFEILEGRRPQPITGFEVIDLSLLSNAQAARAEIPAAGRRHFLVLFDLSFSSPSAIVRAREAAKEMVLNDLHRGDLVAVATYSLQQGPRLVLGFTPDRRQAELAIDTLGLPGIMEQSKVDPLGLIAGELNPAQTLAGGFDTAAGTGTGTEVGGGGGAGARAGAMEAHLRDISLLMGRASREEIQGQAMAYVGGFEGLAKMMANVQGRKYMLLLSEGFDSSILVGTEDIEEQARMSRAIESGQHQEVDSQARYGSTSAMSALEDMLEAFRRADTVIQSIDVGGLRAGHEQTRTGSSRQSLFAMAKDTGGQLYSNFNDLGTAMDKMLDQTSVTYVLSFQPSGLKLDGGYHRLRVRLKEKIRGAEVVHRPGFYAPIPWSERSPTDRALGAAQLVAGGTDGGEILSSVLATPFLVADDISRPYVPVLVDIEGPSLLAGAAADTLALEIYGYAIADDGTVESFFHQNVGLDLTKVKDSLAAAGLKFYGGLRLDPGDHLVRVLVRDLRSGRLSLRTVPVTVPDFSGTDPVLLTPLFPVDFSSWIMVRQEATSEIPYPFTIQGQSYVPAARPVVAASGTAQFFLLGYHLSPDSLALEVSVTTAEGQPVPGAQVAFVERSETGQPDQERLVLTLQSDGLAVGEYLLVANLTDQSSATARTSIPFVVTGNGPG
jgi:VWFA-related protein